MNKKDIISFANKKVFVKTKDNWIYRGQVMSINEDTLVLNDIKDGIVLLNIADLSSLSQFDESKIRAK